jgi:hypothetical protein
LDDLGNGLLDRRLEPDGREFHPGGDGQKTPLLTRLLQGSLTDRTVGQMRVEQGTLAFVEKVVEVFQHLTLTGFTAMHRSLHHGNRPGLSSGRVRTAR